MRSSLTKSFATSMTAPWCRKRRPDDQGNTLWHVITPSRLTSARNGTGVLAMRTGGHRRIVRSGGVRMILLTFEAGGGDEAKPPGGEGLGWGVGVEGAHGACTPPPARFARRPSPSRTARGRG